MLTASTVRTWQRVHKWTSLVCTAFLLMLCVTGLPLIFHHEIDHLLGAAEPPAMPAGTPHAPLDSIVETGLRLHPDQVVQFLIWDDEEPDLVYLSMADSYAAPPADNRLLVLDARTAELLDAPDTQSGFLYVMLTLHVDMFAGLPGQLFFGFMGLLFLVPSVSRVVAVSPFLPRLYFGSGRAHRSRPPT